MAASAAAQAEGEISDRVRSELGSITLQDRLRSQHGKHLVVDLGAAGTVEGVLCQVGSGWVGLEHNRSQVLAVLPHVASIKGMDRFAAGRSGAVQLGVAAALRSIARDRAAVAVRCGGVGAGKALHGIIDRVGRDFLELAAVPDGQARRTGNVTGVYVVPMGSVAAVLTRDPGWD